MKKLSLLFCFLIALTVNSQAQTKVSILGDSYSTFKGAISPSWNEDWYPFDKKDRNGKWRNDVRELDQTWWRLLINQSNGKYVLEKNNSFSGSTISCFGYRNEDYSDRSYIARCLNLGNPDIILIFGCTNDDWTKSPMGEYKYSDWKKSDLYSFRPSLALLLTTAKMYYPDRRIFFILNCDLKAETTESVNTICAHYNIPVIALHNVDKQAGHPSIKGMKTIAEQVAEAIGEK